MDPTTAPMNIDVLDDEQLLKPYRSDLDGRRSRMWIDSWQDPRSSSTAPRDALCMVRVVTRDGPGRIAWATRLAKSRHIDIVAGTAQTLGEGGPHVATYVFRAQPTELENIKPRLTADIEEQSRGHHEDHAPVGPVVLYQVQAVGQDRTGFCHDAASVFADQDVNIRTFLGDRIPRPVGAPEDQPAGRLYGVQMKVEVPADREDEIIEAAKSAFEDYEWAFRITRLKPEKKAQFAPSFGFPVLPN